MKTVAVVLVLSGVAISCAAANDAEVRRDEGSGTDGGGAEPKVDLGANPSGDRDGAVSEVGADAGPVAALDPRADRFATRVVSFTPGACAGFGQAEMPAIVLGPPKGGGASKGSLDVVSLGKGGEIVLSFEPNAVIDGPGVDLIVFENAFYTGGDPNKPYVELAEVSVSEDGVTWATFPCTATAAPYGDCAGWHPVLASGEGDISPLDPSRAGGDQYDLAAIGVKRARFVRIRDKTSQHCTSQGPNTNGFDLDGIAAVHAEDP